MQRHLMALLWVALLIGSSTPALAQEIELVYTKANLMQTLDFDTPPIEIGGFLLHPEPR